MQAPREINLIIIGFTKGKMMKQKTGFLWLSIAILILLATACSVGPKLQKEVFRSDVGGYEYKIPVDFEQTEESGYVQMLAPGTNADTGPVFMMIGAAAPDIATNEDFLSQIQASFGFNTYTDAKKVKVGGKEGLQSDFSVDNNGTKVEGRIVIVVVSPTQQFVMMGGGSSENWKGQTEVFNAILKNVKFFEPTPVAE
jgi:hypothetical protein